MLLASRAGGVGLNLVAASVVILVDPWYVQQHTNTFTVISLQSHNIYVDVVVYRVPTPS